jgi:glycosyltransferase involved in cell wall biosynthesis
MTALGMARLRGLRFAHLIESDGPGGAERVMASIVAELQAAGSENLVIAPATGEGWIARELIRTGAQVQLFHSKGRTSVAFVRWLADTLRRHRSSLVHSHEFTMAAFGAWAARLARVPHLFTMHGSRYYAARLQRRIALGLAARFSSSVVSVSQTLGRHLARDLWIRPSRIVTIPNGVRPVPIIQSSLREELQLGNSDQLVVAVGNLYPVKGHAYLLEALALLATRCPGLHVAVAGRGEREEALRARAHELHVSDRFHLLGLRADIGNVLAGTDVFVLPSLSEGVPLALLEAMLAGRPVVASAVGEVSTVLDGGRAGVLVPPGDPAALANAIADLLSEPARARALGTAARARATAAYSFDAMMDSYLGLYTRALRNHPDDGRSQGIRESQRQPLPKDRSPSKRALVG